MARRETHRQYRRHYVTSWGETILGLMKRADGRFCPIGRSDVAFGSDERKALLRFRQWQAEQQGENNAPAYKAVQSFQQLLNGDPAYAGPSRASLLRLLAELPELSWLPDGAPADRRDPIGDYTLVAAMAFREAREYFRNLILTNPRQAAVELDVEQLAWIGRLEPPEPSLSLDEIGRDYANKKPALSAGWQRRAARLWAEFVACVGVRTVREIAADDIQRYGDGVMGAAGKSPTHSAHRFGLVKSVFAHSLKRGKDQAELQRVLLLCRMLVPARKRSKKPQPIAPEHFAALLGQADVKWKAVLLLSLNAALYPSEVAAVRKNDIDLDAGTLVMDRGKTGVPRVAALWPRTIDAVRAYQKAKPHNSEWLFVGRTGAPYDGNHVSRKFRAFRNVAGLPETVQFADIRDGAYTAAMNGAGVEEKHARLVAGHRNGMADHYVRRNPRCVEAACAAIEQAYFPGAA